jgi:hypothetical protein
MRTPFEKRIHFHSQKVLLFDAFRKHILQSSQNVGSNRRIIPQVPIPCLLRLRYLDSFSA